MSAKKSLSEFMGGVTVFNELTLLREVEPWRKGNNIKRRGIFLCSCGAEKEMDLANVRKGASKTCGCSWKEARQKSRTHGMSRTDIYGIWIGMKDRCYNEKCESYPGWGGRGIKMSDDWRDDFQKFYDDIGKDRPEGRTHTLHRINNDGNYEKGNCMWATRRMQANNRRNTPKTNINGEDISLAEFAAEMGVKYHAVYHQAVTLGKGLVGVIDEMQEKLDRFKATSAD